MDPSWAVAKAPRDMVFLWPLLPTTIREQAAGTTGHRVIGPWQTSWKKVRDFVMEIFLLPSHSPKKPGHPCSSFFLCAANEEIHHWVDSDLALFAVVVLKYSFFFKLKGIQTYKSDVASGSEELNCLSLPLWLVAVIPIRYCDLFSICLFLPSPISICRLTDFWKWEMLILTKKETSERNWINTEKESFIF